MTVYAIKSFQKIHEAMSDYEYTAAEAHGVIATTIQGAMQGAIGAMVIAFSLVMFNKVVAGGAHSSGNPKAIKPMGKFTEPPYKPKKHPPKPVVREVTVPGGSYWKCVSCGKELPPGTRVLKAGREVYCSIPCIKLPGHHSPSGIATSKLFDWSTMEYKPAITGYVTHNTSLGSALKILKDGYIRPSIGSVSFSLDTCFTVASPGVSFIFPESVIRDKYFGKEPGYLIHYPPERVRKIWETEMEIEVKNRLVYIEDCVEILPGKDTCWKYSYGYKYHYVDVRDRDYYPWKEFKR